MQRQRSRKIDLVRRLYVEKIQRGVEVRFASSGRRVTELEIKSGSLSSPRGLMVTIHKYPL